MADRTIHARLSHGRELVRYDRAGKWFVEASVGSGVMYRRVSIREAVDLACVPGVEVFIGLSGGAAFDRKVIAARREELRRREVGLR